MEENQLIILFSALDWGLGHTTRSIPILTYFNKRNAQLMIAVQPGSPSEKVLHQHFPKAIFLPLQGYGITYAKNRKLFAFKIFLQIPKIFKAIRRERKFVQNIVASHPIQLIIADNRYGFYHQSVPSVFITHQLRIAAPLRVMEAIIQKINYRYIQRFSQLWIPDLAGDSNLGGKLSHPLQMPKIPTYYIGLLSRLIDPKNAQKDNIKVANEQITTFKYLFLLSGPEPQRSILEKRLLEIVPKLKEKSILVRGLPTGAQTKENNTNSDLPIGALIGEQQLKIINYADPDTLLHLLQQAEFIVCRSGYSTVMDLLMLGKKGIYIPTPGQTEQQYLARRLMDQHWGYSFAQEEPDYFTAFSKAEKFSFNLPKDFSDQTIQIPNIQGLVK